MKMKASGFLKKLVSIIAKAKSLADLKNRLRNFKTRLMIYSLLSTDKKVLFGSISHKLRGFILHHDHQSPHQGQPCHRSLDQTEAATVEETATAAAAAAEAEEEQSNISLQLAPVLYNNMNAIIQPLHITKIITRDQEEDDEEVASTRYQEDEEEEVAALDQNSTEVTREDEDEDEEEISNFAIPTQEHEENQQDNADAAADDDNEKKDIYPDLRHSLFEDDEYEMGRPGSVIELVKKSKEAQHGEEFKLEDQIDEVADLFIQRFHRQMLIQKQNSFRRRSKNTPHPTN